MANKKKKKSSRPVTFESFRNALLERIRDVVGNNYVVEA